MLKWSTSNSQSNYFPHILGKIMWPPYTISNSESQTSFACSIFSEGMGGGSVHRLGITSKEESEVTNSVQIYTCSSKISAETHPISLKSTFDLEVSRLIVSLAAVFWMSRNAPPKEQERQHCVTSKKQLRGRLPGLMMLFNCQLECTRKRPKRKRERKETKWIEVTGAWENLVILEQLSISSKIVTLYALFALGPSFIVYICKQKLFKQSE